MSNSDNSTMQKRWDFLILEYQAAQARLLQTGAHLHRIEIYLPLALAAFYAWVFAQRISEGVLYRGIICIPVILIIVTFIRCRSEIMFMNRVAAYVKIIEVHLLELSKYTENEILIGFEEHYNSKSSPFLPFQLFYWGLLILISLLILFALPALWPPATSTA